MSTHLTFYLHGFGSDPVKFADSFIDASLGNKVFLEAPENDTFTGKRRWFPFTSNECAIATYVQKATDQVEQMIREHIQKGNTCSLVGHSQGAMICLELVRRGSLELKQVNCYAGFLPEPILAMGKNNGANCEQVHLYSSSLDSFVTQKHTLGTFSFLKSSGVNVRCYITERLDHDFTSEWTMPNNFSELKGGYIGRGV